jgi:SpoVK/Ycf46/Vps4 family AAA+-type ATPase
MGALRSKYVGESEANIRKALQVAETVSPCILWLDELEKALGGATQGAADGGVSADALGAILLWLQERTVPVVVVATANNVDALPPELMRKGRFDEMFFVDLPQPVERAAILRTTMKSFGRDPDTINAAKIAMATNGFSGAEIAALVPEALFTGFADGARPITTGDLLDAANAVVPMSKSQSERITKLRQWAAGRCRSASSAADGTPEATRGTLDI